MRGTEYGFPFMDSLLISCSRDDSSDNKVGGTVTPPKTPNGNINKIISGRITKRVSPRMSTNGGFPL